MNNRSRALGALAALGALGAALYADSVYKLPQKKKILTLMQPYAPAVVAVNQYPLCPLITFTMPDGKVFREYTLPSLTRYNDPSAALYVNDNTVTLKSESTITFTF